MKLSSFQVVAAVLCFWLSSFLLGLWRSTTDITDREAGLISALSVVVAIVVILWRPKQNAALDYHNHHVAAVRNMALRDVQENYRKLITSLKITHNHAMRETQDEIRHLRANFDRLNGEYNWISTMYQDQIRFNEEQDDRIVYLEKKLKEFGQLGSGGAGAPFSAPASQINFANPPCRVRGVLRASSPLTQEPMVQVPEAGED